MFKKSYTLTVHVQEELHSYCSCSRRTSLLLFMFKKNKTLSVHVQEELHSYCCSCSRRTTLLLFMFKKNFTCFTLTVLLKHDFYLRPPTPLPTATATTATTTNLSCYTGCYRATSRQAGSSSSNQLQFQGYTNTLSSRLSLLLLRLALREPAIRMMDIRDVRCVGLKK